MAIDYDNYNVVHIPNDISEQEQFWIDRIEELRQDFVRAAEPYIRQLAKIRACQPMRVMLMPKDDRAGGEAPELDRAKYEALRAKKDKQ